MSQVANILRSSAIAEELSEDEFRVLVTLFDVQEFHSGETLVESGQSYPDRLYVLDHGDIEVRIKSGNDETVIHVCKRGDLAGMIAFAGGALSQINSAMRATANTKVLSMQRADLEGLINSHPNIVYRVMRGVVRNTHSIARNENKESSELRNYIFRNNGRY